MNATPRRLLLFSCETLLRGTALLLSPSDRDNWLAEWRAELRHVIHHGASTSDCFSFIMGSLPDAVWIRRHMVRRAPALAAPQQCIGVLALLMAATVAIALGFPGVRHKMFPGSYPVSSDCVILSNTSSVVGSDMEISAAQYKEWNRHTQPAVARIAFYEPTVGPVENGQIHEQWYVGRTTNNFPALLGTVIPEALIARCHREGVTPILLSYPAWLRDFAGNPKIAGRTLRIANHRVMVVAVAPESASDLPMQMDAWSLESDQSISRLAASRFSWGYIVAQLTPGARTPVRISLISEDGSTSPLYVVPLSSLDAYRRHLPGIDFLLCLITAGSMLAAILGVSARTRLTAERVSRRMRLRGFGFLSAKIALLLPLLYCGPMLLSQLFSSGPHDSVDSVRCFATIGVTLFATFWAIEDQRQRCPSCLHKLTSPARVGDRSRSFLSFSGMEYICSDGHGLLHVPDFPTSWFASERWLLLDSSWQGLFQHGG